MKTIYHGNAKIQVFQKDRTSQVHWFNTIQRAAVLDQVPAHHAVGYDLCFAIFYNVQYFQVKMVIVPMCN